MIDVIIPAYNAHHTIEKTLFSIAFQDIVDDLNVWIVNDCSEKDYSEIVKYFNNFMKIKELKLSENRGPGYARQYGIDNTKNPYIVFIDADDVFFGFNSIRILYETICNEKSDIVFSGFVEETGDEKVEHENTLPWVHGKIYRRKFLEDTNIRFSYTYAHEDVFFNQTILLHEPVESDIPDITYIWCNNENSITRKNDHEYDKTGLSGFIDNITLALEVAIEHNCNPAKIAERALYDLVALFCSFIQHFDDDCTKIILSKAKRVKEITESFPVEDEGERRAIILEQIKTSDYFDDYILNPVVTYSEFLQIVDEA